MKTFSQGVSTKPMRSAHTTTIVAVIGIRAKTRATVGGTPSGILMVKSLWTNQPKILTETKPMIMATKTPLEPTQSIGMLATLTASSAPSGVNRV